MSQKGNVRAFGKREKEKKKKVNPISLGEGAGGGVGRAWRPQGFQML